MSQILIVDDEVGIRELLSEILRDEGLAEQVQRKSERLRPDAETAPCFQDR